MGTLHPSKGGLFQARSDALSVRQAHCRILHASSSQRSGTSCREDSGDHWRHARHRLCHRQEPGQVSCMTPCWPAAQLANALIGMVSSCSDCAGMGMARWFWATTRTAALLARLSGTWKTLMVSQCTVCGCVARAGLRHVRTEAACMDAVQSTGRAFVCCRAMLPTGRCSRRCLES